MLYITSVTFKENSCFICFICKVSVYTLIRYIQLTVSEPLIKRCMTLIKYFIIRCKPIDLFISKAFPKTFIVFYGSVLQFPVHFHTWNSCIFRKFRIWIKNLFFTTHDYLLAYYKFKFFLYISSVYSLVYSYMGQKSIY